MVSAEVLDKLAPKQRDQRGREACRVVAKLVRTFGSDVAHSIVQGIAGECRTNDPMRHILALMESTEEESGEW